MSTIMDHPALVLTPAFSFWTFGPLRAGVCAYRRKETKICLSFWLTWINTFLTIGGIAALIRFYEHYSGLISGVNYDHVFLGFWAGVLVAIAIISLLLIQFVDKCKWLMFWFCGCLYCCWKRYEDRCFPMTQKIVYNTENPHQWDILVEWHKLLPNLCLCLSKNDWFRCASFDKLFFTWQKIKSSTTGNA